MDVPFNFSLFSIDVCVLVNRFMFGPDWLVAPVTTYQAANWTVYLPALPAPQVWVYFFNETVINGLSRLFFCDVM